MNPADPYDEDVYGDNPYGVPLPEDQKNDGRNQKNHHEQHDRKP